jgi:hypothetical protein
MLKQIPLLILSSYRNIFSCKFNNNVQRVTTFFTTVERASLHVIWRPQTLSTAPPSPRLLRSLAMSRCGGAPKSFFVVAAKVLRVCIAHTEPGARRVQVFAEHQTACFLESYLFLKLQRAHHCDALEMMVEARNAHAWFTRGLFDFKRLIEVCAQTPDRPGEAAGVHSR